MDIVEHNKFYTKRHPWELARLHILMQLLRAHLDPKKKYHVLDIGCGDCFFTEALLKRWPNIYVTAIDTAYNIKDAALKEKEIGHPHFKLFNNLDAAESHLITHEVHMVLLMDVIEHIQNDMEFLEKLHTSSFVKKETKIFITVPAFQVLFSAHDIYLRHFRRYNLKELISTISRVGFSPIDSGYFFSLLLSVRVIQKAKEKISIVAHQHGVGKWKGSEMITSIIKKILIFDYWVARNLHKLGITVPGLSVFVICEKK